MYKKYQQNIWLANELIIKSKGNTTYKYKLYKKLTEITGKKNAINWMKEYYLKKNFVKISKNKLSLVLELCDNPSNQFFLVLPIAKKNNVFKLAYINISGHFINNDKK